MIYFSGTLNLSNHKPLSSRTGCIGLLVWLFFVPTTLTYAAAPSISNLNAQERQWLAKHKTIRIAYDGDFAPYSFINKQGRLEGIAVDFMDLISQRLHIKFVTSPKLNWKELYKAAAAHKTDVVATMVDRPDRHIWFSFTKPYLSKSLVIVTKKTNDKITKREDLAKKTVALSKDYEYQERVLQSFPSIKPKRVSSMKEGFEAVKHGKIDAAITFLATTNYLQLKYPFDDLRVVDFYERDSANESIAVRGDWPILAGILQKALDSITDEDKQVIFAKWMPRPQPEQSPPKPDPQPELAPVVSLPPEPQVEEKATISTVCADYGLFAFIIGALLLLGLGQAKRARNKIARLTAANTAQSKQIMALQTDLEQLVLERSIDFNSTEHRFRNLLENLRYEFFFYQQNKQGELTYVSPAVSTVLGYTPEEFMANFRNYLTENPINQKLKAHPDASGQALLPQPAYEVEIYDAKKTSRWLEIIDKPVYDEYGNCTAIDGFIHDITSRKAVPSSTADDEAAGWVNRDLFNDRVQQIIHRCIREQTEFAVIYMQVEAAETDDLDAKTKTELFKLAAKRIMPKLRKSDTAAKLANNQLLLALPETDAESANLVAKKFMQELLLPYHIDAADLTPLVSIGISVFTGQSKDIAELIKQAETAMYFAKSEKFGVAVFSEFM